MTVLANDVDIPVQYNPDATIVVNDRDVGDFGFPDESLAWAVSFGHTINCTSGDTGCDSEGERFYNAADIGAAITAYRSLWLSPVQPLGLEDLIELSVPYRRLLSLHHKMLDHDQNTVCIRRFSSMFAKHAEFVSKLPDRGFPRVSPEPTVSGVYFIRAGNMVKIGHSHNPESRLKSIQTSNPVKLEMLHVIRTRHQWSCEEKLHARFREDRVCGEWFVYSDRIKSFIATLKAKCG